jgi:hypothetical protein
VGTLWAPGAATIFLISTVTQVSWTRLFLPCLILGLLGLVLAYLMEHRQPYMRVQPVPSRSEPATPVTAHVPLMGLVLAVLVLLALSFVLMEKR